MLCYAPERATQHNSILRSADEWCHSGSVGAVGTKSASGAAEHASGCVGEAVVSILVCVSAENADERVCVCCVNSVVLCWFGTCLR